MRTAAIEGTDDADIYTLGAHMEITLHLEKAKGEIDILAGARCRIAKFEDNCNTQSQSNTLFLGTARPL